MNFLKRLWNTIFRPKKPKYSKPIKLTQEQTNTLKKKIKGRIAQARQRMAYKKELFSKPPSNIRRSGKNKILGREKKFSRKVLNKKEMLIKRERMVKVFWDRIRNIIGSDIDITGNTFVDNLINEAMQNGDYQQLHNLYMFIGKYDLVQWDKILSPDSYKDQALVEASESENKQALIDAVMSYAKTYNIDTNNYEENRINFDIPDQQDLVKQWDLGL